MNWWFEKDIGDFEILEIVEIGLIKEMGFNENTGWIL